MKKKKLTLTNIFIIICSVIFILDRYIIPESSNILYSNPTLFDTLIGHSHGKLTLLLGTLGNNFVNNGYALYRNFTVCLLHDNILHILVNMIGLYIAGNFVEEKIGKVKTGILFLLTVFIVSITILPIFSLVIPSEYFNDYTNSFIAVGASGGVFGIMGVMLGICTVNPSLLNEISKKKKILLALYGFIFTYIASGIISTTTYMHNIGFLSGFILGTIVYIFTRPKENTERNSSVINRMSIISLELFIFTIVFDFLFVLFSSYLNTVGTIIYNSILITILIFSIFISNRALKQIKETNEKGKKIAKIAKILSIVYIIFTLLNTIIFLAIGPINISTAI